MRRDNKEGRMGPDRARLDRRGKCGEGEREYKRLTRGLWEIYNAANKPNFPPTKDRWTTLNSMSSQSQAMKTITVSTPNQECIGFELMCVGTAGKLEQRQRESQQEGRLCTAAKGWFVLCIHIDRKWTAFAQEPKVSRDNINTTS